MVYKYKLMWKNVGTFPLSQSELKNEKANSRDDRSNNQGEKCNW